MENWGLTYEEVQEIVHLCHWIVIDRCPPNFDFRGFLLGRLRPKSPETAARVEHLTDDQLQRLCQEVMQQQKLFR